MFLRRDCEMNRINVYCRVVSDALMGVSSGIINEVENWDDFYHFCDQQSLLGVVFGEMERADSYKGLPKILLLTWIGEAQQIQAQNQKVNNELLALNQLLSDNKIRFAVVKGQIAASFYPCPDLRMSGDIDLYCPDNMIDMACLQIERQWGVNLEQSDSLYHYHFEHGEITFELHFRLFYFYQKKRDAYWSNLLNDSIGYCIKIDGVSVPTLNPTVNVLFVFLHLYHHLIEVGVGLRQFCDLAVMLKEGVDKPLLRQHLELLGMVKAFKACEFVLCEKLGLPEAYLPYSISSTDRKYGERMLSVVLYRGNMGHYNRMAHFRFLESLCIKASHLYKFFWLSPGYFIGWMMMRIRIFFPSFKSISV